MPHPTAKSRTSSPSVWSRVTSITSLAVVTLAIAMALFSLPTVIAVDLKFARSEAPKPAFPVTVNPRLQTITEDPEVEAFLEDHTTSLQASVSLAGDYLTKLALFISSLPAYQSLAGANASGLVEIKAGYREEEVATVFAQQLGWNAAQKRVFLKQLKVAEPVMNEGEFVPGVYPVRGLLMTPGDVQIMLNERFMQEIKNRYSTSTERQVPLADALTIASMLEKETKDPEEMRIISGIIWNRLWIGMKLQIDATLQYAKATNDPNAKSWWPTPLPKDKYIKSPYNTYQNKGLPPGPISNPSTAAVLAALNPKNTDCLFYFHDSRGVFHCTETYKQHVTLLRKYYGQGK